MILFFTRETNLLMLDLMIKTGGYKSTALSKYNLEFQINV